MLLFMEIPTTKTPKHIVVSEVSTSKYGNPSLCCFLLAQYIVGRKTSIVIKGKCGATSKQKPITMPKTTHKVSFMDTKLS